MIIHRTGLLATALSLASLSGCAAAPFGQLPHAFFAVGQEDTAIDVAARPVRMGELRVNLASVLAQLKKRRVLSTIADVDHVVVTVTPTGGTAVTQTVSKTAIASGQTTVSFPGLPVGTADVSIVVYDATGATLGSSAQQASIVAGQVATVDLFVQLPSTTLPPASGGGGSSTPSTGSLNANVFIQEGAVVQNLPSGGIVETYKLPYLPLHVVVMPDGKAWAILNDGLTYYNHLARFSPVGALERLVKFTDATIADLAVTENGQLMAVGSWNGSPAMLELDAEGGIVSHHTIPGNPPVANGFGFDGRQMFVFSVPGYSTPAWLWNIDDTATLALSDVGRLVSFGRNDDIWCTLNPAAYDEVAHVSRTGTVISRSSVGNGFTASYSAVDAQGNVWVNAYQVGAPGTPASNGKTVKLSPTGQVLNTTMLTKAKAPQAIHIDPSGRIWVLDSYDGAHGSVTWLDANGVEQGSVDLAGLDEPWEFAVGVSGAWVISHNAKTLTRIAPAAN